MMRLVYNWWKNFRAKGLGEKAHYYLGVYILRDSMYETPYKDIVKAGKEFFRLYRSVESIEYHRDITQKHVEILSARRNAMGREIEALKEEKDSHEQSTTS